MKYRKFALSLCSKFSVEVLKKHSTNQEIKISNMDISLMQNYIGVRTRFKEYRRKYSMFNRKADINGLFASCAAHMWLLNVRPNH